MLTSDAVLRWPLNSTHTNARPTIGNATTLISCPGKDLQRATYSTDGQRLAVAGRGRSFVLNLNEPTNVVEFSRGNSQSHAVLSPDKRWIAATTHNGMGASIWREDGRLHRLLLTNENSIAAFSPDGRTLVTTSSRDYSHWDTDTWAIRRKDALDLGSAVAGPLAFSPDGKLLAVAANRRDIRLLNPVTGEELATLTAPDPVNLSRLAFCADGSRLAATAIGRSIQLWDLRTLRRELAKLGLDW